MSHFFRIWRGWSRYTMQHKLQSAICIIGLAVGLTCYTLSMLWLRHIESFEDFVPDAERVYLSGQKHNGTVQGRSTYNGSSEAAQIFTEMCPEIEDAAQIISFRFESRIKRNDNGTEYDLKSKAVWTDNKFLELFGIKPIAGSIDTLRQGEVYISRTVAREVFGDEDPIGKEIHISEESTNRETDATITAVVEDVPENSQFGYDIYHPLPPDNFNIYTTTFFKLHPGSDPAKVEKRIYDAYGGDQRALAYRFNQDLMPIRELRSVYPTAQGCVTVGYVRIFMAIGLVVILSALTNYIITLITNMRIRARSMALHRLLGASIWKIVGLNSLDTLTLFIISSTLGLICTYFLLPTFRIYSGITASSALIYTDITKYLAAATVVGISVAALTTLIVLRRSHRTILQGHQSHRSSSVLDRSAIVVQLTVCLIIMISTATLTLQLNYLANTNALGFERANVFTFLPVTEQMRQKIKTSPYMAEELIDGYSFFPIFILTVASLNIDAPEGKRDIELEQWHINDNMVKFWRLNIKSGRTPRPGVNEIMVNETACASLGETPESILGKTYAYTEKGHATVVGVLANIYTNLPSIEPTPTMFTHTGDISEKIMMDNYEHHPYSVKVHPGFRQEFIDSINVWVETEQEAYAIANPDDKRSWEHTSSFPSDIEEMYDRIIASEHLLCKLLSAIALCSVLISLMGVYSTLSLSLQERRKEMAIRQLHGAKPIRIAGMFERDYMRSMLISVVIAFPASISIMQPWLEHYQKHIAFPYLWAAAIIAALAGIISAVIYIKVITAAKANPSTALDSN